MTLQLDLLMERLRSVEAEIETELAKRREELRYHLENRRIVFERDGFTASSRHGRRATSSMPIRW